MKNFGGYLEDAYISWLSAMATCCGAVEPHASSQSTSHTPSPWLHSPNSDQAERHIKIEHDQPRLNSSPILKPQERPTTRGREWVVQGRNFASRASSRGSFSVRRKLYAYNGFHGRPWKMDISSPSEFRHVETLGPRRTERFMPLELNIYQPGDKQLSPILPHFGAEDSLSASNDACLAYPPLVKTHSRSDSATSFRIPRKPVRSSSGTSSEWTANFRSRPDSLSAQDLLVALENELPKNPEPARLRSMTAPPAYERVRSALHEKYELEQRLKDIEEIIEERQSIYLNSRPGSRATDVRSTSIYSDAQDPMPLAPPPILSRFQLPIADQRPKTAPARPVQIPIRHKSFKEASSIFSTPPQTSRSPSSLRYAYELPPPPPLPLVLQPRPPLRKKKSFSRVSNWLFPSDHTRSTSHGIVTNAPKPVTSRDGFYQCVDLRNRRDGRDRDDDSVSTVSTVESELDATTLPTTWSPYSTPGKFEVNGMELRTRTFSVDSATEKVSEEKSLDLDRVRTFGEEEESWRLRIPGRDSVGVAF